MKDESPIEFPCDFVIKVMGEANERFEALVLQIAQRHSQMVHLDKTTKKHSKKGDYVSITLTVHFENKAQMDSLYQEMRETPEILMAL